MPEPSDPDTPPDSLPVRQTGGRNLFGFLRRKQDQAASLNGHAPEVQNDIRLRLSAFEESRVENVMIPRADIIAIELGTPFDEVLKVFAEEAHSRMPIYRETLDDPVGFVHIKDVVARISEGSDAGRRPLEKLRRDILFVPPSMRLADLLVKMQSTRIHLALVVDEYGGTDGLVSLEDLVEEIVGEIEDEHDEDAPLITRRSQRVWEADARAEIIHFSEETGIDLSLPDYEDEIDTLGGVAFALAGKIPVRGEILQHPSGNDLEIMEADGRRIWRLRVRMRAAKA